MAKGEDYWATEVRWQESVYLYTPAITLSLRHHLDIQPVNHTTLLD